MHVLHKTVLFFLCMLSGLTTMYGEAVSGTEPEPKRVTVFVHGVIGLRHYISIKTFVKLLRNGRYLPYEKSIWRIREDPFFYQNQPISWLGLHPVNMYDRKMGAAANLFAFVFDALSACPGQTRYYTFGWSGLAGSNSCQEAAETFYEELREELKELDPTSKNLTIDIIGYSRGGNITLNLATIRAKKHPHDTFTFNNVTLIGTPVLKDSRELITSSLFRKVYHIYSRKDWVQNNDFFSCCQLVSTRRFKNLDLPPLNGKLTQIEARITEITASGCHTIDRSPNHNELWFFAWPTPSHAELSPLAPFPFAAFIPLIIDRLETVAPHINDAIVDIRPQAEQVIIRKRNHQKPRYIAPFVSQSLLQELQKQAESQKPSSYNNKLFKAHALSAIKQAQPCRVPIKRRHRVSLCGA